MGETARSAGRPAFARRGLGRDRSFDARRAILSFHLDASFVVSLFLRDVHTSEADHWIERAPGPIIVSELCAVEFAAVVSRGVRTGRLSPAEAEATLSDFDEWRSMCSSLHRVGTADFARADTLVRDFATKLAAADALHLATAMNAGPSLVTFDGRLAEAARMQGVEVVRLGT